MESRSFSTSLRTQFSFHTNMTKLTLVLRRLADSGINVLAMKLDGKDAEMVLGMGGAATVASDNRRLGGILDELNINYSEQVVSEVTIPVGVAGTYYKILHTLHEGGLRVHSLYHSEVGSIIIDSSHPYKANELLSSL